jgi:hypothetical protein
MTKIDYLRLLIIIVINIFSSLNNMTVVPTSIDIYIPRILGDVSTSIVKKAFKMLQIGEVIDIDMHRKKNENGYFYFFAFIKLQLWQTEQAAQMITLLDERDIMHLVYDEEACQYWEVKKYVPRNKRPLKDQIKDTCLNVINNINGIIGLSEQDRIDLNNEYDELEREIYQLTCVA